MYAEWLDELVLVDGVKVHKSCLDMMAKPPSEDQRQTGLKRCRELRQMIQQHKDKALAEAKDKLRPRTFDASQFMIAGR